MLIQVDYSLLTEFAEKAINLYKIYFLGEMRDSLNRGNCSHSPPGRNENWSLVTDSHSRSISFSPKKISMIKDFIRSRISLNCFMRLVGLLDMFCKFQWFLDFCNFEFNEWNCCKNVDELGAILVILQCMCMCTHKSNRACTRVHILSVSTYTHTVCNFWR